MWSSQTTGELQPRPGMFVFHLTFSVSLQDSGRLGSSGTAPISGPRNIGHWSLAEAATTAVRANAATTSARGTQASLSPPTRHGRRAPFYRVSESGHLVIWSSSSFGDLVDLVAWSMGHQHHRTRTSDQMTR